MRKSYCDVTRRRENVWEYVKNDPSISISSLALLNHVSELTIRRDLKYLRDNGHLPFDNHRFIDNFSKSSLSKKYQIIAKYCANIIVDNDVVFLNSSDFFTEIVSNITSQNVTIITNHANFNDLILPKSLNLLSLGGNLISNYYAFLGEFTIDNIRKITAKKAFLFADAISLETGITCDNLHESSICKAMLSRTTGQSYFIIKSIGINEKKAFHICDINESTHFITSNGNINNFRLRGATVSCLDEV